MNYTYVPEEDDYLMESNEDEFLIDQIRCEQDFNSVVKVCKKIF